MITQIPQVQKLKFSTSSWKEFREIEGTNLTDQKDLKKLMKPSWIKRSRWWECGESDHRLGENVKRREKEMF